LSIRPRARQVSDALHVEAGEVPTMVLLKTPAYCREVPVPLVAM
jgi:hypothetical protein